MARTRWIFKKHRTIISLTTGIVLGLFLGMWFCAAQGSAKMVEEYLGKYIASSYTADSNTPSGTHNTSSGAYATEGTTVAVDHRNPIVPIGSKVKLVWKENGKKKSHIFTIQDYGNFGHLNGGMRQFDVFFEHHGWGLKKVKAYLIRKETKKEKAKRIAAEKRKARKKRRTEQEKPFKLIYDPTLLPWQIKTDPDIIPSGTVLVQWNNILWGWLDVIGTKKGIGHTIYIGDHTKALLRREIYLQDVIEEAVG